MKSVLIIGKGTVGSNLGKEIVKLKPEFIDKYKKIDTRTCKHYDFGFVCVDTPFRGNTLDISEVVNAVNENDCDIYILKSTCPVGTVDMIKEKTGKRIIFSPEYYGGTQHCNNFKFNFTVLGGERSDCYEVENLLMNVYDATHVFRVVDSKSAEIIKLMENSWLATKVTFCCEFSRLCEKYGVSYEEVREGFILDPRVNASHTFVYRDHEYFDSHCLNKDVPYTASLGVELLKDVVAINEKRKKQE